MNIDKLIIPEIIEKHCGVKIAEGGFSMHEDNKIIGMNIQTLYDNSMDYFIKLEYYMHCLQMEIESCK